MLPGEMDAMVGAGLSAGIGGVGFAFGFEPPLQPESKERERIEPTKSRKQGRTSSPWQTSRSRERPVKVLVPLERQTVGP